MLTVLREKRVEVAKFIAAMLVFTVLSRWKFLPEDYTGGEVVKLLVDFIASVAVVFLVADIALGQPTITLEWRTESSNRPKNGEILIRVKKQSINLQVKVSGESLLQKYLLHRSRRTRFVIEIHFSPHGAIKIIQQSGSDEFKMGADRQSFIFDKVLMGATGLVAFSDFTVKRKAAAGYEHEIKVDVAARWEPRICRTPATLAKIETGIERIVLEA